METEKFLNRLEETLSQLVRQQEAICAELVGMRERVDALGEVAAKEAGGAPTHPLVGPLDDNHVFLAAERLDDSGFRKWPNHVHMN